MLQRIEDCVALKCLSRGVLGVATAGLLALPVPASAEPPGGRHRGGERHVAHGGGGGRHADSGRHVRHERRQHRRDVRHERRHHRRDVRHERRHHRRDVRHERRHHRHERCHHPRYHRGVRHAHGPYVRYRSHPHRTGRFFCAPCSHHFRYRSHFYDHLHHHHHLALVDIPLLLVSGLVEGLYGWIFYG